MSDEKHHFAKEIHISYYIDIIYIFLMECPKILSLSISSCMPSNHILIKKKYFHHTLHLMLQKLYSCQVFLAGSKGHFLNMPLFVNVKSRPSSSLADQFSPAGLEREIQFEIM